MKGVNLSLVFSLKSSALSILVVMVTVANCNTNSNIVFELLEEQKADTFVGNVAQKSGVLTEVSPSEAQNLRFQILTSDGLRISSIFTMNIRTGLLYTNAMIDREQLCDSTVVTCKLEFDVTVKVDVAILRILHVVVIIMDINDNPPSFPVKVYFQNISEASPKGSDFSIPSAVDRDDQANTSISYWIEDNPNFGLNEDKLWGVSLLKVVLLQELDREKETQHELHIFAKDGNTTSSLTETLTVVVYVVDANDNSPQFVEPVLNLTVSEDGKVGDVVGAVNATDLDVGENGRITYQLSPSTSGKFKQLFSLDENTGKITVKSNLQYDSGDSFQAVIVAMDHGSSPKASQGIVTITIIDVGNTPPQVSIVLVDPMIQNSIALSEDLPNAWFVGTLRYTDSDKGDNGAVDCTSLNSHFALEYLENGGYAIEIDTPLDRETESEFAVVLKCSDHGSPSLSTSINFTVRVLDANDNRPVFEKRVYNGTVKEGVASVTKFLQVIATDRDEGINKEVKYRLAENSTSSIVIDPSSGWLSLISSIDRETVPFIRLTVEAVDKGTPPLTGSVDVTIFVDDVNDNKPEIAIFNYAVKENQDGGAIVAQIVAVDLDQGLNAQLLFKLLSDPAGGYRVSDDGVITTTQPFDRETTDRYIIIVSVSDKGTPSLSSSATLTIEISDVNDNSPDILFPRPGNDTTNISAGLYPGSFITRVVAFDLDIGRNSKLAYLIAEGSNVFGIDNSTGTVFLVKRLTSSKVTNYRLTISVQDSGTTRLYKNSVLYINVDFTNVTLVDTSSTMEQKYAIISGVIAGVTLVIAVVVITIILKMRRSDPARSREGRLKSNKQINVPHSGAKIFSEVNSLHVSSFKVESTYKDVEVKGDKGRGQDNNVSLDSTLTNGSIPPSYRSTLTRELLDCQMVGVSPPLYLESRDRIQSDDVNSDASGDANTSDSGRGASDGDDVSSGASLPPPYPRDTTTPMFTASRLPLTDNRMVQNMEARNFSLIHHLGSGNIAPQLPPGDCISQTGSSLMNQRQPSRVRFSIDEHRNQYNHYGRPLLTNGQHFNNFSNRSNQEIVGQLRNIPLQQFPGSCLMNTQPRALKEDSQSREEFRHDPRNQATSLPLNKDSLAKHNLFQSGVHASHPSINNRLIVPNYHNHYNPQQQHHSGVVSQSGDDDDDNNSTTTSGSYVIDTAEDSITASVNC